MSHSSSPNNRTSIFGWVKNLKRGNSTSNESVNEVISDNEISAIESRSPTKSIASGTIPQMLQQPHHHHSGTSSQEFLRPLLHYKARSTNNVNRVRSNSFNAPEKSPSIKAHRDSFLQHNALVDENSSYFGVSLEEATNQAAAKISILTNETAGHVLQYGKIPIVVAKCGVYLKQNGLTMEGIFRVGGSSKRVKELQMLFNTPPEFGKKLNWDGYTVHDAASVLRRYLNALPEPLIPLDMYEEFRDPLRQRPRIINYLKYKAENLGKSSNSIQTLNNLNISTSRLAGSNSTSTPGENSGASASPLSETGYSTKKLNSVNSQSIRKPEESVAESDLDNQENTAAGERPNESIKAKKSKNYKKLRIHTREAINEYKYLVDMLPDLSKQLLFYILDLLAMVQNHSKENLMPSRNLAAIFQPSILSHPNHDMDPTEYLLSQHVVEFLISYAYKLLPNQSHTPPRSIGGAVETDNSTTTSAADALEYQEPFTLLKPQSQHPYKRQHSKSLSHSSNHDDLIGFPNKPNFNKAPVIDSDHDFGLSDDNELSESELPQMQNLNLVLESANNMSDDKIISSIASPDNKQDTVQQQTVIADNTKNNIPNVEIVVTASSATPQED